MDLIKIGRYIADKRKGLGMTQRQLAEKLGMSDKSVSKWERGVCLPDVSVYSELCQLLEISIHEFLAGEDIPQENIMQKAEENIIDVTADSKKKQNKLKAIICILVISSFLVLSALGIAVYLENRPQNFLAPVAQDSIEMETAKLFAGIDGAYIYHFTATDEYDSIRIHISEYHAGKLVNHGIILSLGNMDSPEHGSILIFPDFENFVVKIVVSAGGSTGSSEIHILENVADRRYYGRSATGIQESTDIRYGEEQPLVALIYDNDIMSVPPIDNLLDENLWILEENDYVYCFSFEFCRE